MRIPAQKDTRKSGGRPNPHRKTNIQTTKFKGEGYDGQEVKVRCGVGPRRKEEINVRLV